MKTIIYLKEQFLKLIFGVFIFTAFNSLNAQTVLYSQNFNTLSAPEWTLNVTTGAPINSTSDTQYNNYWIINSNYTGYISTKHPGENIANTPKANQPTPGSGYMHITGGDNAYRMAKEVYPGINSSGVYTISGSSFSSIASVPLDTSYDAWAFETPDNAGNIFTAMNKDISTTGQTGVQFNFWWMCAGSGTVTTGDYGQVCYSIDGGVTWTILSTIYNKKGTGWQLANVSSLTSAFDNQAKLRFGFQWVQQVAGYMSDQDPPMCVDDITITSVNTCPVAIATQGGTNPTCGNPNGGTYTITATGGSPLTYHVTNGSTINDSVTTTTGTGTITGLSAGNYTVSVSNGTCSVAGNPFVFTAGGAPKAPTVSSNAPCVGGTLQLNATDTGTTVTYQWSGPNSYGSATQNPTIPNVVIGDTGTYTVTVTVNGCSVSGTTHVTINPAPTPPTLGSNSPVCQGGTLNLTAATVAGATYSWTGPGFATANANQNPSINAVPATDSGYYVLTTTVTGCPPVKDSIHVAITPGPPAITAGNNGPFCAGAAISLTSTTTATGVTYSWAGPNGFKSSAADTTIANSVIGETGTYTVTISNGGCGSSSSTTNVVVNAVPVTPSVGSNTPVCSGQALNLTVEAQPGATYSWTGPGFATANTNQNPTIANAVVGDSGTYTVTVTIGTCGSTSGSTLVAVKPGLPTIIAANDGPICPGQTLGLTVTNVAGATYAWSGPQSFSSAIYNPTISNISGNQAGTYSVTVTNSCGSIVKTTTVVVQNSVATPQLFYKNPICIGDTVKVWASPIPGASYSWTGPNGFTGAKDTSFKLNAALNDSGNYILTATVNGCGSNQATLAVKVLTQLPAFIINSNSPICAGSTLTLSTTANYPPSLTKYGWSEPGGVTAIGDSISIDRVTQAANNGIYSVTVTYNNCTATANTNVVINSLPITKLYNGSYCFGQSAVIDAGPGFTSYIWTDDSIISTDSILTIQAFNTVIYDTLTVSNNNGCKKVYYVTSTFLPKPDTTTFSIIGSGPNGDTLVSSFSNAQAYQWYEDTNKLFNGVNDTFIALHSNYYSVVVTDSNSCSTTSEVKYVLITGINELSSTGNIDIYPNPATGQFNIHCSGAADKSIRMTLYNVIGQKVIDNNYHISGGETIPVSIDKLASGIYMVRVEADNQSFTRKLVIQQ